MQKLNSLIIGGTRGIGLVIKNKFLSRGDLVFTASRSPIDDPNHFSINLPNLNGIDENIKLNYLIFTHRYRGNDWEEDFDISVKSINLLINKLKDRFSEESSIVILGSSAGKFVFTEQSASYHSTRAALEGLMKFYAVSLGNRGIRCNLVFPSTVIKPENEEFFNDKNEIRKMIEFITPLNRMGNAADVANMVEFLCSEKSSFITGQAFWVDGGLSIRSQESIAREYISARTANQR